MNHKKNILKFTAIFIFSFICINIYSQNDNFFESSKNIEIFTELYKELDLIYVDEIESGDLIKTAIDEMLSSLDPYTTYIPETDIEDYRFMTTGQYGGIGAIISKRGDYVIITEPYEGFPAEKAGLLAGDKILEVNGQSAKGKSTEELSEILKGQPNTIVNILIERNGEKITKSFKREKITVESVPYYGIIDEGIGYIKLRSFTRGCANDVKTALTSLKSNQQLRGIILDLRGNPGGLLNESIDIVNLFVEKGEVIVVTKGKIKDWEKKYTATNNPIDTKTPLIVLINSNSASASEIVSGSIQDLDRGIIIGQRSFGKGLVQQTRKLPYNSQLKVTVAKYYIPSGRCIQSLDYSNKNTDGSVGKIPDSLTSIFYTKNGRKVRDGGGINPDISVERKVIPEITRSLISNRLIFDFATQFRYINESISSVEKFQITEDIFNDFEEFLSDKEYEYTTATEEALDLFIEISKEEEVYEQIQHKILNIENQLRDGKLNDLRENKQNINEFLANEIVSRYYYQKGRIVEDLKHDMEILKSVSLLNNLEEYYNKLNFNE